MMSRTHHSLLAIAALLAVTPCVAQQPTPSIAQLRAGFMQPPPQARLRCYWWWLNGNTDKATITNDLEEMKAKGFGGALLVDANGANQNGNDNVPPGPTFGSPAWVALFTHALAEADRLGLEITLNITSGWNLGGPSVKPEQASKILTYARMQIAGGTHVVVHAPVPAQKNGFYRQIAVLAYPLAHGPELAAQPKDGQVDRYVDSRAPQRSRSAEQTLRFRSAAAETGFSMPDASGMLNDGTTTEFAADPTYSDTDLKHVLDISSSVSPDGTLTWDPPAGQWEILAVGYTDSGAMVSTASGAWQGLAIDYMSREAFTQYWAETMEPLLAAGKPYKSLRYLATDSWELGGTNWTAGFREKFTRLRGYDPMPWLPVVSGRIVGDRAQSTRFLTDLRRTVADLISTEHYDVFAEKAREHGMGVQAESGGPHGAPIDALETFRHAAVPQSEFWSQNPHRSTDVERFFTKEAASAVNIYGQHFVAQEGETSIGPQWSESLTTDLKPSFDMGITEGMNRLVWHEFTSSPAATGLPGQEYFAGTHINPKITWWNASAPFFTYLNRAQFLMQQGVPVDDVLYFYGDNVPNFVRDKADDPAHVLPGYDYDVTNEDALLHTITTDHGKLRGPGGVEWKLLALPATGRLSLDALQRIEAYVQSGGAVSGPRPTSPTGNVTPQTQASFAALTASIWGPTCAPGTQHTFGQGQVFCTTDAHAALAALKLQPDVQPADGVALTATSTATLDYIHRRIAQADVYFLRNGSPKDVATDITFRAKGNPQLWNLVTGEICTPSATQLPNGRTRLPLHLPAFASTAILFAAQAAPPPEPCHPIPSNATVVKPLHSWTVTFQPNRGAPTGSIKVDHLTSWTTWPQPGVRFFSGTATYRASVIVPAHRPGAPIWLTFPDVREIAQVRINGKDAGTVWANPRTLRVDSLLQPGENTLEIEVTNLWPNRLIGDQQPGTTHTFTQTNITTYKASSPLLPSGLIGDLLWSIEP